MQHRRWWCSTQVQEVLNLDTTTDRSRPARQPSLEAHLKPDRINLRTVAPEMAVRQRTMAPKSGRMASRDIVVACQRPSEPIPARRKLGGYEANKNNQCCTCQPSIMDIVSGFLVYYQVVIGGRQTPPYVSGRREKCASRGGYLK